MSSLQPSLNLAKFYHSEHLKQKGLRFSGSPSSLVSDITHGQIAEKTRKIFGHISLEERPFGLSRQDVTSRVNVGTAVYLPAFFFSFIPHKKHFYETNGRNLLLWWTTLGLTLLTKSPKYGLNPPLTYLFMNSKKQRPLSPKGGFASVVHDYFKKPLERLSRPLRPNYNYFELLEYLVPEKKYSLKERQDAKWSGLSDNYKAALERRFALLKNNPEELQKLARHLEIPSVEAATALGDFTSRATRLKLFSAATSAFLAVTVLGVALMQIVLKYIAPLDPDFQENTQGVTNNNTASSKSFSKPSQQKLDGFFTAPGNQFPGFSMRSKQAFVPSSLKKPSLYLNSGSAYYPAPMTYPQQARPESSLIQQKRDEQYVVY